MFYWIIQITRLNIKNIKIIIDHEETIKNKTLITKTLKLIKTKADATYVPYNNIVTVHHLSIIFDKYKDTQHHYQYFDGYSV